MKYNEKLYYAEDVNGFHIRAMDKRFKYSCLESLEEFDRICSRCGIKYYVMYGTLLGTIRHKGFIPWDDDIDVAMMRADYNRFINAARDVMRPPFVLCDVEDSCYHPLRVQNGHTIRIDNEFINRFHGCPYPTGIDIYVLDKLPESEEEQEILKTLFSMVTWASQYSSKYYTRYSGERTNKEDEDFEGAINALEDFLNVSIKRDGTESKQLGKLAYRIAAMYSDCNSDYVARVESWYFDGVRGKFHKDLFRDTIMMPFEHMMVPVPSGYHEILTHLYGDYMKLVKGGGAHEYGTYRTMEKQLFDWLTENEIDIPPFLME